MAEERVERRLAAILAADVVGYSRLMGADEEGTLSALKRHRSEVIDPKVAAHRGRVVKTVGDGVLIEFASAMDAVRCAVEVQQDMAAHNAAIAPDKRIELRLGINVGDVIVDDDDIYGEGVNVAARLEGLAEPGAVFVSGTVFDQVKGKPPFVFEDLGPKRVKNIAEPLRVYRVALAAPTGAAPADAVSLALPARPSIAVLPFVNMSGDPEQEYFADGIAEDIITGLSRLKWLFVIARNSSFTYKGRNVDVRQVGRELGVRYVLEGSVRRGGDRLRITGQLVEAETGNHLWAERYDGALADVFDLQDRIAEGVVGAIEPSVRHAEIERSRRVRPGSLDAYDLYLRALPHAWAYTPDGAAKAIELLDQALRIDPAYTAAHGLAAWCHHVRIRNEHGGFEPDERDAAIRHARMVLASATDDSIALVHAAFVVANCERDYDAALEAVRRALALTPNSATVHVYGAVVNCYAGRFDAAIDLAQRSFRLSPFDPMQYQANLAIAYANFFSDRHAEAAEAAQRAVHSHPKFVPGHAILAASLACLGRPQEARATADRLLALLPEFRIGNFVGTGRFAADLNERYAAALRAAGLPE